MMKRKNKTGCNGNSAVISILMLTLLATTSSAGFLLWEKNWQDETMNDYGAKMDNSNEMFNETFEEVMNSTESSEDICDYGHIDNATYEEDS